MPLHVSSTCVHHHAVKIALHSLWYHHTYRLVRVVSCASACHTDTTPTSHTESPTHIERRTHNQCGDTIKKSQVPDDGRINVRNMLSIEVK